MKFACEIIPQTFLVLIRKEISHKLTSIGFTQKQISSCLGISQPVISLYLKDKNYQKNPLRSRNGFQELISKIVDDIANNISSEAQLMNQICSLCQQWRMLGPICELHRRKNDFQLPVGCNICYKDLSHSQLSLMKIDTVRSLYEGAQLLVNDYSFTDHIPEIGCQFINSIDRPKSIDDIVSFPGRIIRIKDKAKIIAPYPEFGISETSSKILLELIRAGSSHRSLITLKNSKRLLKRLSNKYKLIETEGADLDWNKVLNNVLSTVGRDITVIADSGAPGYESIIYYFGKDPIEIAKNLIKIFQEP